MGNCMQVSKAQSDVKNLSNVLSADDRRRNNEIGEYMKKEELNDVRLKKILLLGAGMSCINLRCILSFV